MLGSCQPVSSSCAWSTYGVHMEVFFNYLSVYFLGFLLFYLCFLTDTLHTIFPPPSQTRAESMNQGISLLKGKRIWSLLAELFLDLLCLQSSLCPYPIHTSGPKVPPSPLALHSYPVWHSVYFCTWLQSVYLTTLSFGLFDCFMTKALARCIY